MQKRERGHRLQIRRQGLPPNGDRQDHALGTVSLRAALSIKET